jgi:hypothetical protein
MYAPQKDSPSTVTIGEITPTDTQIVVQTASLLPTALPFPLTLGIDKGVTETVLVTAINENALTATRAFHGQALTWTAGTKCARVFTAADLLTLQQNALALLAGVTQEAADRDAAVAAEAEARQNSDILLVESLMDEADRAVAAEAANAAATAAEQSRATGVEATLNTSKPNRSELTSVVTGATLLAGETQVAVTFVTYNSATQTTNQFVRYLPIASGSAAGVMLPEMYGTVESLVSDVETLKNQGGKFIGVSFATAADLAGWTIPNTVHAGDFTYVLDDETHDYATTRWIFNGTAFAFAYVISYDPVGVATAETAGLVKSDSGSTGGKVFVELDGTMSVVGWDSLLQLVSANSAAISSVVADVQAPNTGLNTRVASLESALSGLDASLAELASAASGLMGT